MNLPCVTYRYFPGFLRGYFSSKCTGVVIISLIMRMVPWGCTSVDAFLDLDRSGCRRVESSVCSCVFRCHFYFTADKAALTVLLVIHLQKPRHDHYMPSHYIYIHLLRFWERGYNSIFWYVILFWFIDKMRIWREPNSNLLTDYTRTLNNILKNNDFYTW